VTQLALPPPLASSAVLSDCGRYRYRLDRELNPANPQSLLWVMANPSTADASVDDPTIRKVRGFTQRLGYGRFTVVNLYAYRATDPATLVAAAQRGEDVVGPENADRVFHAIFEADLVVVAWGRCLADRAALDLSFAERQVVAAIQYHRGQAHCLGRTQGGHPRHPLMLPYSTPLEVYS
jgi:hypothetical protein